MIFKLRQKKEPVGQERQPPGLPLTAVSPQQIDLGLKRSRLEWFYNLKQKVSRRSAVIEALPYWRNVNTVLALLCSIAFIVIIIYVEGRNYQQLPDRIPFFYQQASNSWALTDKEVILPVPIFLAVNLGVLIRLSSVIYKFDRRLALMLNTGIIIFNLLGLVAFIQMMSLILIY